METTSAMRSGQPSRVDGFRTAATLALASRYVYACRTSWWIAQLGLLPHATRRVRTRGKALDFQVRGRPDTAHEAGPGKGRCLRDPPSGGGTVIPNLVTVDTVLPGYRLGTDQGRVAFCGVNLIQGADEAGVHRRILVDTGHAADVRRLKPNSGGAASHRPTSTSWSARMRTGTTSRTSTSSGVPRSSSTRTNDATPVGRTNDFGCPPSIGSVLDLSRTGSRRYRRERRSSLA